jgi:hypothetical protein
MKKYGLTFLLSIMVVFSINSQEHISENTLFLHRLFPQYKLNAFGNNYFGPNSLPFGEIDNNMIFPHYYFNYGQKSPETPIVENNVNDTIYGYIGLMGLVFGIVMAYTVPNNLRSNTIQSDKQEQERLDYLLEKSREYNNFVNNGFNKFWH